MIHNLDPTNDDNEVLADQMNVSVWAQQVSYRLTVSILNSWSKNEILEVEPNEVRP